MTVTIIGGAELSCTAHVPADEHRRSMRQAQERAHRRVGRAGGGLDLELVARQRVELGALRELEGSLLHLRTRKGLSGHHPALCARPQWPSAAGVAGLHSLLVTRAHLAQLLCKIRGGARLGREAGVRAREEEQDAADQAEPGEGHATVTDSAVLPWWPGRSGYVRCGQDS